MIIKQRFSKGARLVTSVYAMYKIGRDAAPAATSIVSELDKYLNIDD